MHILHEIVTIINILYSLSLGRGKSKSIVIKTECVGEIHSSCLVTDTPLFIVRNPAEKGVFFPFVPQNIINCANDNGEIHRPIP